MKLFLEFIFAAVITIIFAAILLMVISALPVLAEPVGIHGETTFRYDTASDAGQSWLIDLHYNVTPAFAIGASESTFTDGFKTINGFPSFRPNEQLYEVYLRYEVAPGLVLRLSQWCRHTVYSGGGSQSGYNDGLYFQGTYKF